MRLDVRAFFLDARAVFFRLMQAALRAVRVFLTVLGTENGT